MFTRDDLVTGLFVKLRSGDLGVVAGNRIILQKGTYVDLFDYADNLHCKLHYSDHTDYDIMEVRGCGMNAHLDCFDNFKNMSLRYIRDTFTLDKIKDGDIVTITRKDCLPFDFYKCGDLLLPVDSTVGAYNLSNFDKQTLCFIVDNANIKISKVLRPCCEVEYARSQRDVVKVVYEREE